MMLGVPAAYHDFTIEVSGNDWDVLSRLSMITEGAWIGLDLSQKCMLRYYHIRFETLSRAQKVHIRWGGLRRASLRSLTNHQHTCGGETLVEELGMYFTAPRKVWTLVA